VKHELPMGRLRMVFFSVRPSGHFTGYLYSLVARRGANPNGRLVRVAMVNLYGRKEFGVGTEPFECLHAGPCGEPPYSGPADAANSQSSIFLQVSSDGSFKEICSPKPRLCSGISKEKSSTGK